MIKRKVNVEDRFQAIADKLRLMPEGEKFLDHHENCDDMNNHERMDKCDSCYYDEMYANYCEAAYD